MRAVALVLLLVASAAHADRAADATNAVKVIGETKTSLTQQLTFSLNELADAKYGFDETLRKTLVALAEWDTKREAIIADALGEVAVDFVAASCRGAKIADLVNGKPAEVARTCGLAKKHAAPSKILPTMRPAALLYAAYLVDLLSQRKASENELVLARWVAHYGRADEATAKPLKRP